jgi:integrase
MQLMAALDLFFLSMQGVLSPATIRFYRNHLKYLGEFFGDCDLQSISITQLRAWRVTLIERHSRWGQGSSHPAQPGKLSPFTIHKFVRAARRFFRWLSAEGLLETNPAQRLELPRLPRPRPRGISSEDRDRLLVAANDHPRDLAIILVLSDTACRRGGLAGLRLSDLDLHHRTILAREKGRGGQGKERWLYFTKRTAAAIRAWLELRPDCLGDSLFGISPDGVYQVLKRLASKAGISDGWNPHNFRHAAIRNWLAAGMPLPQASQLAGHSSVAVTADIYGLFNELELQKAHDKYSWIT